MIDPTRLRALLSDHPPQAFHQREQAAIRDVWEAAREMLDAWERGRPGKVSYGVDRSGPGESQILHTEGRPFAAGSSVRIIPAATTEE